MRCSSQIQYCVTFAGATASPEPQGLGTRLPALKWGSRLKVKTYWGAYALLDPEPENLDLSHLQPVEAPAPDVILEVRQNMEAMRSGDSVTGGAPPAFSEPRPLGWVSSLKAIVNARRHFPEDGPLPTLAPVPEASSSSVRSRQSGLQRPSGLPVARRFGELTPGGLAPLPAERHLGTVRQNPLLDSSRSEAGLLDNPHSVEMTHNWSTDRQRDGRM